MNDDERFRSRKWILFTRTLIGVSALGIGLIVAAVLGFDVEKVDGLLWWWSAVASAILGGYGAVNLGAQKIRKGE